MVLDPVINSRNKIGIKWCAFFGYIGVVLILAMAVSIAAFATNYKPLKASVTYSDNIFVFKNDDDFDWKGVQFLLNTDYKFTTPIIPAHTDFAVDATNFAKDDSTKFDPNGMAPSDFIVTAKVTDLQWSSWFYKFGQN